LAACRADVIDGALARGAAIFAAVDRAGDGICQAGLGSTDRQTRLSHRLSVSACAELSWNLVAELKNMAAGAEGEAVRPRQDRQGLSTTGAKLVDEFLQRINRPDNLFLRSPSELTALGMTVRPIGI
jgi:hypothetical protein